MTTAPPPQPPPSPSPPPKTVRKLVVEVADARNLLPKDGQGSSSPYVVADFDGQRKRTATKIRELNPVWNEPLEFIVSDPDNMDYEELDIEVFNDKRYGNGSGRKNHFLGRVKLYGSQFAKRGDEGLVYYQLEKKSVFSWIRGEIGLRIYYYDELVEEAPPPPPPQEEQPPPPTVAEKPKTPEAVVEEVRMFELPPQDEVGRDDSNSPPVVVIEESPRQEMPVHSEPPPAEVNGPPPGEGQFPPEMRRMQSNKAPGFGEGIRVLRRPNGDYSPRVINKKFMAETERIHPYDLVEPMQYLFIRIVKARNLAPNERPYLQIRTSGHFVKSDPASHRPGEPTDSPEWNRVFALRHNRPDTANTTLEIAVWDTSSEQFLGGVCFDLSDVPVRDPPDSPLAPQWYRLEGGAGDQQPSKISGDIQLSVWIGTQADDAFSEAWCSDAPHVAHTRSKVYQSPKLWYLRVSVIEAQDLHIASNLPPLTAPEIRVKAQLSFQSARTRRGSMNNHSASFHWNEDLVFVACEPLEDSLILLVEDRTSKEAVLLGHVMIPVDTIEQRFDERYVAAKWFSLEGGNGGETYSGRIYLRLCLEGGYHVLDEAAHVCSDFRPTAKQLWKPAVGILELGILGARGLLPMKTKDPLFLSFCSSSNAFLISTIFSLRIQVPSDPNYCPFRLSFQFCVSVFVGWLCAMEPDNKFLNVGVLVVATLLFAKLISALLNSRSNKRAPPTVKGFPFVGGLLRFLKGPIVMLRKEYPKLGSVFTLNLLHKKITFLIGPEVSSHFFKASESDLSQQEVYQFNVPTFGPGVVFDVDYSIRQEQFRFFTEALRVTKLKGYVDQMVREAEDFFSKWGDSGEVDLKYELEHLIILTASRCLLGSEVRDKLFADVSALFHDLDNGMLPISVMFPYLPIPAHRRRDQARSKLADIFAKIIASRKCNGSSENDMLQCFIDSKYKDGRSTTDSEVTGLLIAALFAGQHTSSITSTWTGAYLLRHKEYMSAVLEEQQKLMGKHGDKIDHDILSEMDNLYRCIKEALRLHPPLIMLMRSSHRDFSVTTREGKEYDIPKGHIIATSPAFANRLPHVYKEPDRYDPDRFAPGRDEDKAAGPFSYISFGGGRHGCLGEPFAYLQIKAIWSHLLRNFELELISPFPEIDWNAMVVGVKGKVMVRYKRRKLSVS